MGKDEASDSSWLVQRERVAASAAGAARTHPRRPVGGWLNQWWCCLLYTREAADELRGILRCGRIWL